MCTGRGSSTACYTVEHYLPYCMYMPYCNHRVGTPTLRTLLTHRTHHAILADGPLNATMQEVIELGRLELRTPLDAVVELVWQRPSVGWS